MEDRVLLAARNNALWCDAMCRAHGVPTEFTKQLWVCRGAPPRFHSSATTLKPGAIEDIRSLSPKHGFKDGFYDVNGSEFGYTELFQAEWIWLENPGPSTNILDWRRVETDAELLAWEAGWAEGDEEASHFPRHFPPSLLVDPDNAFLAGFAGNDLVAGCILNLTGPVVGISNAFNLRPTSFDTWHDLSRLPENWFPGFPTVGYERGEDLRLARSAGFESIGRLRVWTRP